MELEQLDIFNVDFTMDIPKTGAITLLQDMYCITSGTKVYLSSNYRDVYEVINDNGENAVVKYTNEYVNRKDQTEMTVPSKKISAIIEADGTVIPLPTNTRPSNLDLDFYRGRVVQFTNDIMVDREKQLDFLTYLFLVTPSLSVNKSVNYIWDHLRAVRINTSVKYRMFSISSYIKNNERLMSFLSTTHVGNIDVRYKQDGEDYRYHVKDIIKHFYLMKKRINEKEIGHLNPFELSLLYRFKGYVLTYFVETEEWYIQHPDSNKVMPIINGRDELNLVDNVIAKYENKFIKRPFKMSTMIIQELELFENNSYQSEMSGFILPEGAIVQLTAANGYNRYIVIKDDGTSISLRDTDDYENIITVSSETVARVYPYTDKQNMCISLPKYNRPRTLTLDTLIERDQSYYHLLSNKEVSDLVVIKTLELSGAEAKPRIVRAMLEGDENLAKEIIKKSQGGVHSGSFSYNSDGQSKKIRLGYEDKPIDITMTTNQIVQHYKNMVRNIQWASFSSLSVYELELAYFLNGFNLKYNHVTDEFKLSKGIHSIDVSKGRQYLNDFQKVVADSQNIGRRNQLIEGKQ